MRFEVIKVTPALAAEWLARPWVRQRTVSNRITEKYAEAMSQGRWEEPSLDPIGFTVEGELANGQHRLLAVIKSGWSGEMLVAFDVPAVNFLVHDTGRRRLPAQFIKLPQAKQVASAARLVLWYDRSYPAPPRGSASLFDNDVILGFVDDNEEALLDAARDAGRVYKYTHIPPGVHGAVLFIARRGEMDEGRISQWVEGLASGANLEARDPRLLLRQKISRSRSLSLDITAMWAVTVRAFNAYMHGRELANLRQDGDVPPFIKLSPYHTVHNGYGRR